MGDGDVPAVLDHPGDVAGRLVGRLVLIFYRLMLFVFDQRVAANSDDGQFIAHCLGFSFKSRPLAVIVW